MYITSDIFVGRNQAFDNPFLRPLHGNVDVTTNMLGKRKRIIGEDEHLGRLHSPLPPSHWTDTLAMKVTLPDPPKPAPIYNNITDCCSSPRTPSKRSSEHVAQSPPAKRRMSITRRHTGPLFIKAAAQTPTQDSFSSGPTTTQPCHRCYRVPRQKKELQGYINCERPQCGVRACSVCTRVCDCGKKVCSSPACSVEEGVEGTIYCLECYQRKSDELLRVSERIMSG